jgi:hypothetical protein
VGIDLWVEGGRYVHATHIETNMGYFLKICKERYVRITSQFDYMSIKTFVNLS